MKYVLYLPNLFTGCHSTKNNYDGIGKKHKKQTLRPELYLYITNYSCKLPASVQASDSSQTKL